MSVLAPPKKDINDNLLYELLFIEEDLEGVDVPHNDALVLTVNICNYDVRMVLIDHRSSSDAVYLNAYNKLRRFIPSKNVRSINTPIYSFSRDPIWPICTVDVRVRIGEATTNVEFFVINIDFPYNVLLGRNWPRGVKAVTFPFHQKLKFPSLKRVVVVRGKQEDVQYCFNLVVQGSLLEKPIHRIPPKSLSLLMGQVCL